MLVELSEIPFTGAFKGEGIPPSRDCEPLITQLEDPAYCGEMKASGSCKIQVCPISVLLPYKKRHFL
jgi:hypothetical protein